MRKIVYITGSRAEYGVMKNLLKMLEKDHFFKLSLVVTGMHLSKDFGLTVKDIKKEGFKIEGLVDMKLKDNTRVGMAKSLGWAIIGISEVLERLKPQIVLVAGDRGEILAAAITANHLNIPVAHISGGDITTGATIDERLRHAITKLSDIHFPANERSAKNIIKMGENPECVFPVGNPGIPVKYHLSEKRKKELIRRYNLDLKKPLILALQHSVTTQVESAASQMRETMEAVKSLKMPTIVIYPNSDAGSEEMIKIIHKYEDLDFIRVYKNIERENFTDLMALSDVIIGNSSCALLEAPSFNLPAVNIGVRQEGREHSSNVINVDHDRAKIVDAMKKALTEEFKNRVKKSLNLYVKRNTEENIVKILKKIRLSDFPRKKFEKKQKFL